MENSRLHCRLDDVGGGVYLPHMRYAITRSSVLATNEIFNYIKTSQKRFQNLNLFT